MTIDLQNNYIWGIPPYTFWACIGIVYSIIFFLFLLYRNNIKIERQLLICVMGIVGMMLGAKVFGCIKNIIIVLYYQQAITSEVIRNSGLIYYGGLIGFLLFSYIAIRVLYHEYNLILMNLIMITIPLFHSFGRIGCLFAGCCFGKECNIGLTINYIYDSQRIISRFPTQLIESACELLNFFFLLYIHKKNPNRNLLKIYLTIYACVRFILEFTRADEIRGILNGLSFSQYISIAIIILIISLSSASTINSKENEL